METALDDRHRLNAEAKAKAGVTHQQHHGSVGVYTGCVQPGAELRGGGAHRGETGRSDNLLAYCKEDPLNRCK